MKILFQILMLSSIIALASAAVDMSDFREYCNHECKYKHTICRRAPCLVSRFNCGDDAKPKIFSDAGRLTVLKILNEIRANTTYNNKTIANMRALNYNTELEFIAECWANACKVNADLCRTSKEYKEVGQTFVRVKNKTYPGYNPMRFALETWKIELGSIAKTTISNYTDSDLYANISQLLWAETHQVGCGITYFKENNIMVVCNFAPAGNKEGKSIFELGTPASKCGDQPINTNFTGLCGESKLLHTNNITRLFSGVPSFENGLFFSILVIIGIAFLLI